MKPDNSIFIFSSVNAVFVQVQQTLNQQIVCIKKKSYQYFEKEVTNIILLFASLVKGHLVILI